MEYYEQEQKPYTFLSPLIIIGLILFVLAWFPFINFPKWCMGLGVVIIILGGVHSVAMLMYNN